MNPEFKKKWRQLWQSWWWLFLIFVITLFMDAISTIHFMRMVGPEAELHPAVRMVSYLFGPVVGPILAVFGKAIAMVLVLFYLKRWAPVVLTVSSVLYLLAFFYNLYAVDLYLSGRLPWLPI